MFDMAWSEIFVIGAVALVAIGPKDLPKTMLMLGRGARQVRLMAAQVRQQFDQLTYEAEIAARAAEKPEEVKSSENPPAAPKPDTSPPHEG